MSFETVQIGPCTLIRGDCLEVLPTLEPGSVNAVVTDPPYGINTKSDGSGKLNPWMDLCNASFWYAQWIAESRRVLAWDGFLWSFLNWRSLVTFQKAALDVKWPIESLMVWDKEWIGPGGSSGLRPSYEMVALWCHHDAAIKDRGVPDVKRCMWSSHKPSGHPAEKPEELIGFLLGISGATSVGDWFCGSGTVPAVCARRNIKCVAIESDPEWFASSCNRVDAAWREKRSELQFEPQTKMVQQQLVTA